MAERRRRGLVTSGDVAIDRWFAVDGGGARRVLAAATDGGEPRRKIRDSRRVGRGRGLGRRRIEGRVAVALPAEGVLFAITTHPASVAPTGGAR